MNTRDRATFEFLFTFLPPALRNLSFIFQNKMKAELLLEL